MNNYIRETNERGKVPLPKENVGPLPQPTKCELDGGMDDKSNTSFGP